jgi:methyl coenzyme M reductase subunit C
MFFFASLKCKTNTTVRLANGQRVTSSTVCEITFELAKHEFKRTFYVRRDLRALDMMLA